MVKSRVTRATVLRDQRERAMNRVNPFQAGTPMHDGYEQQRAIEVADLMSLERLEKIREIARSASKGVVDAVSTGRAKSLVETVEVALQSAIEAGHIAIVGDRTEAKARPSRAKRRGAS